MTPDYYTETETYYPPDQTICEAERTLTYFYQGPSQTQYDVQDVTLYGCATVWVGYVLFTLTRHSDERGES